MKKKNIKIYGDGIYCKSAMEKSQNYLINKANGSLRAALSDIENLLTKTYFLAEINEATVSELKDLYRLRLKLSAAVNSFKYKFMR